MLQEFSHTFTFAATGHAETQYRVLNCGTLPGLTHTIVYVLSDSANVITGTFNLYDPHGALLYTKAAIAKGATTVEKQEYTFGEGWIMGFDPSGDAGVGGLTATVYIYFDDLR